MTNDLNTLLKKFQFYIEIECGYSKNTWFAYLNDFNLMLHFMHQQNINNISISSFNKFLDFIQTLNEKDSTKKRRNMFVKSFFNFMVCYNLINKEDKEKLNDYTYESKSNRNSILSESDFDSILRSVSCSNYRLVLLILYNHGLRISELCELRFSDLSEDMSSLRIKGKNNIERIVYLEKNIINLIKNMNYTNINDKIFNLGTRQNISQKISKILNANGVYNITPHDLRRSYAVNLFKKGISINKISMSLGHSNLQSTRQYLPLSIEDLKNVHNKFFMR